MNELEILALGAVHTKLLLKAVAEGDKAEERKQHDILNDLTRQVLALA